MIPEDIPLRPLPVHRLMLSQFYHSYMVRVLYSGLALLVLKSIGMATAFVTLVWLISIANEVSVVRDSEWRSAIYEASLADHNAFSGNVNVENQTSSETVPTQFTSGTTTTDNYGFQPVTLHQVASVSNLFGACCEKSTFALPDEQSTSVSELTTEPHTCGSSVKSQNNQERSQRLSTITSSPAVSPTVFGRVGSPPKKRRREDDSVQDEGPQNPFIWDLMTNSVALGQECVIKEPRPSFVFEDLSGQEADKKFLKEKAPKQTAPTKVESKSSVNCKSAEVGTTGLCGVNPEKPARSKGPPFIRKESASKINNQNQFVCQSGHGHYDGFIVGGRMKQVRSGSKLVMTSNSSIQQAITRSPKNERKFIGSKGKGVGHVASKPSPNQMVNDKSFKTSEEPTHHRVNRRFNNDPRNTKTCEKDNSKEKNFIPSPDPPNCVNTSFAIKATGSDPDGSGKGDPDGEWHVVKKRGKRESRATNTTALSNSSTPQLTTRSPVNTTGSTRSIEEEKEQARSGYNLRQANKLERKNKNTGVQKGRRKEKEKSGLAGPKVELLTVTKTPTGTNEKDKPSETRTSGFECVKPKSFTVSECDTDSEVLRRIRDRTLKEKKRDFAEDCSINEESVESQQKSTDNLDSGKRKGPPLPTINPGSGLRSDDHVNQPQIPTVPPTETSKRDKPLETEIFGFEGVKLECFTVPGCDTDSDFVRRIRDRTSKGEKRVWADECSVSEESMESQPTSTDNLNSGRRTDAPLPILNPVSGLNNDNHVDQQQTSIVPVVTFEPSNNDNQSDVWDTFDIEGVGDDLVIDKGPGTECQITDDLDPGLKGSFEDEDENLERRSLPITTGVKVDEIELSWNQQGKLVKRRKERGDLSKPTTRNLTEAEKKSIRAQRKRAAINDSTPKKTDHQKEFARLMGFKSYFHVRAFFFSDSIPRENKIKAPEFEKYLYYKGRGQTYKLLERDWDRVAFKNRSVTTPALNYSAIEAAAKLYSKYAREEN
eukprot:271097_1